MRLNVDYLKMYEANKEDFYSDEAIFNRRVKALKLIEENYCLKELIADMNEADIEYHHRERKAICNYLRKKFGIQLASQDIGNVMFEKVYEDKEASYLLWRNGVTINVSNLKNGDRSGSFENSISDIYRLAANFFGDLPIK